MVCQEKSEIICALSPMQSVIFRNYAMPNDLRALSVMRHNIRALLDIRKESQAELARTMKHGFGTTYQLISQRW